MQCSDWPVAGLDPGVFFTESRRRQCNVWGEGDPSKSNKWVGVTLVTWRATPSPTQPHSTTILLFIAQSVRTQIPFRAEFRVISQVFSPAMPSRSSQIGVQLWDGLRPLKEGPGHCSGSLIEITSLSVSFHRSRAEPSANERAVFQPRDYNRPIRGRGESSQRNIV